jgi:endoglucanase
MAIKNFKTVAVFLVGICLVFTLILTHNFFKTNVVHGDTIPNFSVYADQLAPQFMNWSWNGNVNFANKNPVYQGVTAISFTNDGGYGGFYIHTDQGVATSSYQALLFAAKAAGTGQSYVVTAYDTNNQQTHAPVSLDKYGGQPDANNWKIYTIPLQDINANDKTIKGIAIQEAAGKSQQTVYLDSIAFTNGAQPTDAAGANTSSNPLAGAVFFNDPDANPAKQQQQQWQASRPNDAAQIAKIADQPKAIWIGSWNGNVQADVQKIVTEAADTVPVFVSYNIPNRDCGSYSAGGSGSADAYTSWISSFAQGIGNRRTVVILEPDALAQISCLSADDQAQRYALLANAVQTFKSLGNTSVYIDAGHSGWIGAADMANRLNQAGIAKADGFVLNVSNFMTSADSITYGSQLAALVANKHFVIDTSRNGSGPTGDNAWCNPSGRSLGDKPTTQTNNPLVDAYFWVKYPGESDGTCNGGPSAGIWFADYALELADNASF